MNGYSAEARRFERSTRRSEVGMQLGDVLAAKRRRLGTALHELATELAHERRRNSRLERENERLRRLLENAG